MFDIDKIKKDFPILEGIHYLDSAATTQKPLVVLDAVRDYYLHENANPHRSAHKLGNAATEAIENSRKVIADFINAKPNELVFTKSTTESLNLISHCLEYSEVKAGDEILITIAEHHANLITWQQVAQNTGAKLVYAYLNDDVTLNVDEFLSKINSKTRVVAFNQASNVTGSITDAKALIKEIRAKSSAYIVVDGAQSMPHMKVDVKDMDCDFFVASGHKMLAPMGIGIMYGKEEIINKLHPFLFGGDMIEYVFEDSASFLDSPFRYEAGTQNVGGAVGFAAAIKYLEQIGMENVYNHEKELIDYAYNEFKKMDDIILYTTPKKKSGVLSFNIEGAHPHDIATILDSKNVMIRSGHHCAQPLHRYLKKPFSARASFYIYNDKKDVDALIEGVQYVREVLKLGTR